MSADYGYEDDFESDGCYLCGGLGFVTICVDDMCRSSNGCIHGDGDIDCQVCNKDGEKEWIK